MRVLILTLLLTGCTIQYPVWLGDPGVAEMCEGGSGTYLYTHRGETKEFVVEVMEWPQAATYCTERSGETAKACIVNRRYIYVDGGVNCPKSMAHELSHGFGMDFVDPPDIGLGRL